MRKHAHYAAETPLISVASNSYNKQCELEGTFLNILFSYELFGDF